MQNAVSLNCFLPGVDDSGVFQGWSYLQTVYPTLRSDLKNRHPLVSPKYLDLYAQLEYTIQFENSRKAAYQILLQMVKKDPRWLYDEVPGYSFSPVVSPPISPITLPLLNESPPSSPTSVSPFLSSKPYNYLSNSSSSRSPSPSSPLHGSPSPSSSLHGSPSPSSSLHGSPSATGPVHASPLSQDLTEKRLKRLSLSGVKRTTFGGSNDFTPRGKRSSIVASDDECVEDKKCNSNRDDWRKTSSPEPKKHKGKGSAVQKKRSFNFTSPKNWDKKE